uniref:Piezo_RRas_bdg domain-containing protein n=1 Tax=Echinostoma caproni TaxID=27848 RepID=A0A183AS47_9TREM
LWIIFIEKIQSFLIILITLSCIFTLSHPTLHIVLAVAPPYDNALKTCKSVILMLYFFSGEEVTIAAQIGKPIRRIVIQSLNRTLTPESYNRLGSLNGTSKLGLNFSRDWDDRRRKLWRAWAVDTFCTIFTVVLICATGIISPSVTSAVYLLSFLGICTYWACRSKVNPTPFASLRIFLAIYSGLHICLYYLYQFPFFQTFSGWISTSDERLAYLINFHPSIQLVGKYLQFNGFFNWCIVRACQSEFSRM